jgi:hypothetical protein
LQAAINAGNKAVSLVLSSQGMLRRSGRHRTDEERERI